MYYEVISRYIYFFTIHNAVFSGSRYYFYYALRGIFVEWILFILCTSQYFRGVDPICTMHYAVFSGDGYYLYYALDSIFGGWILLYHPLRSIFRGWILLILFSTQYFGEWTLFILCTTQYFRRVDTIYTMYYAVFAGSGYNLSYVLRSISKG